MKGVLLMTFDLRLLAHKIQPIGRSMCHVCGWGEGHSQPLANAYEW